MRENGGGTREHHSGKACLPGAKPLGRLVLFSPDSCRRPAEEEEGGRGMKVEDGGGGMGGCRENNVMNATETQTGRCSKHWELPHTTGGVEWRRLVWASTSGLCVAITTEMHPCSTTPEPNEWVNTRPLQNC
ncbi:hypothetical protein ILYODFUR_036636 [Ilyodon furcidens]|uniref:Uncharacterized protein n=1 Tax=Ilyodon furcidens TaxID=33524 RepID=A0ABV0U1F6_9TELE